MISKEIVIYFLVRVLFFAIICVITFQHRHGHHGSSTTLWLGSYVFIEFLCLQLVLFWFVWERYCNKERHTYVSLFQSSLASETATPSNKIKCRLQGIQFIENYKSILFNGFLVVPFVMSAVGIVVASIENRQMETMIAFIYTIVFLCSNCIVMKDIRI